MTQAHTTTEHLLLAYSYPAHEPRESDPHYHVFNETRKRLKKLGALKCWIGNADCQGDIELHHSVVEFSLSNIVDTKHFNELYPDFACTDDNTFLDWVEGEGNLLPLCGPVHHRGILGIHTIHYPAWLVQRFMKAGVDAPEKKVVEK